MLSNPTNDCEAQSLIQRIEGAEPGQIHVMLLGAGEKYLDLAITAMSNGDSSSKSRHLSRVSEIIMELTGRLNHEAGSELVANLARIYSWWIDVLFDASQRNQPERLQVISNQMGEMRAAWEQLLQAPAVPELAGSSNQG